MDNQLVNTLVDVELSKLSAIKVIKLALLNLLSTQIQSATDELQNSSITDLLESPIFSFIVETLLPLLSGKDSTKIWNVLFPNLSNSNDVWPHEHLGTPVIHEGKSTTVSKEALFEDSSSTIPKGSPVRKILKL
ncbi:hypothetical protein WH47_02652 [Habropoda laboriosa]|uniref:Uncharacterized protein n=1 Tax=Habropoda laboriosa TaxID=597456 RepID=A0A0L7QWZ1_9HYME|nr:hypothetical protein WH47_02652 [Habropoda laboriosa]